MDNQEVLDIPSTSTSTSGVGIQHEYSASLDVAMKRVKDWERLKECIKGAKWSANHLADMNYKNGYMSALSLIEGRMSEMENEDGEN